MKKVLGIILGALFTMFISCNLQTFAAPPGHHSHNKTMHKPASHHAVKPHAKHHHVVKPHAKHHHAVKPHAKHHATPHKPIFNHHPQKPMMQPQAKHPAARPEMQRPARPEAQRPVARPEAQRPAARSGAQRPTKPVTQKTEKQYNDSAAVEETDATYEEETAEEDNSTESKILDKVDAFSNIIQNVKTLKE